jgi:hypothetical protein
LIVQLDPVGEDRGQLLLRVLAHGRGHARGSAAPDAELGDHTIGGCQVAGEMESDIAPAKFRDRDAIIGLCGIPTLYFDRRKLVFRGYVDCYLAQCFRRNVTGSSG